MEILIKSKIDIIKNSKYSQAELNHRLLPDMHAVTDIRAKLYQLSYESKCVPIARFRGAMRALSMVTQDWGFASTGNRTQDLPLTKRVL